MMPAPHIMVVEPYAGGHQAYYLECLLREWSQRTDDGRVTVVVGPAFSQRHPGFAAWVESLHRDVDLLEAEFRAPTDGGVLRLIARDRSHGRIVRDLINDLRPDGVLLMYLDHFQFSLATGLRFRFPLHVSGVYFRPSFHYRRKMEGTGHGLVRSYLSRLLFHLACRNPHVRTVFPLDPILAESVANLECDVVALPEPSTPLLPDRPRSDPRTVLLIGSLTRLKGVIQFLESVDMLADAVRHSGRFVIAGLIADDLVETVSKWHDSIASAGVTSSIVNRFLADDEVEDYVARAGVVVLPYQQHVGMSNVLVRAAKHGRPVIGPAFGLLGALIRRHGLGLPVNTANPREISDGIAEFLTSHRVPGFDAASAHAFAERNTAEAFADTILQTVCAKSLNQ